MIVETSALCIEIEGDGGWHILEREAYCLVKRSLHDHATIIIRDSSGRRELRDLGERGERRAWLPSTSAKWERGTARVLDVER